MERWASFDCYGTLIDWTSGIRDALSRLWAERDADLLVSAYHALEPEVQRGRSIAYRDVLAETLAGVARREGLDLREDDLSALAASLPRWPVFPEVSAALVALRARGWKLAILSNTDPDLLDASIRRIGVPIDVKITAADAGSYKPAHGHWHRFFERTGADPSTHVHVAASLFHDIAPCKELGVTAVWVNRSAEASDLPRAREVPNLRDVPALLEHLVPRER